MSTVYEFNSPPVKNSAFTFSVALTSQADTDIFKTTPTLAAGDITVDIDGAGFGNIGTLPTQIGTTGVLPVALTAAEMNGNIIRVLFHDVAGSEWQDLLVEIRTVAATTVSDGTGVTLANNAITAAVIATDAIDADAIADAAIDAGAIATDAIGSDEISAAAVTKIQAGLATPASVWDRLTSALTTAGSIGKALADLLAVFNAVTRTLTQSAAAVTAAVSGSDLAVTKYTTYSTTLTGMTIPATWTKIWLTAKTDSRALDADSQVMILVSNPGAATDGGQHYNRTAATVTTRAYASLTVDQPNGTIAVVITDEGTSLLAQGEYRYDVKCLVAAGSIQQLAGEAAFVVDASYTVAIA